LELARLTGVVLGDADAAAPWVGVARAEARRYPGDADRAARLAWTTGAVARRAGHLEDARASLEEALARRAETDGEDGVELAPILLDLSATRGALGDPKGALADAERAVRIVDAAPTLSGGPERAPYDLGLGDALLGTGAPRDALAAFDRARDIASQFGAATGSTALRAAAGRAIAHRALGESDEAARAVDEALANLLEDAGERVSFHDPRGTRSAAAVDFAAKVRSKVDRPDDLVEIVERNAHACLLAARGDEARGLGELTDLAATEEKNPSLEGSPRGAIHHNIALLSLRAGDLSAASKHAELALSAFVLEVGPRHVRTAVGKLLYAKVLAREGSRTARDVATEAETLLADALGPDDARSRAAEALAKGSAP
jgi:tetratricopeptide (TPR) repeat protein